MSRPKFMNFQTSSERNYLHQNIPAHIRSPSDVFDNVNETKKQLAKIPMSLTIEDYPSQFSQANPFCAICGKYIPKTESFNTFNSVQRKKKYLIHAECSQNSEQKSLTVCQASQAKLQSIAFLNHIRSIALGGKQFYIQLEVLHPLGGFSFAKLWTKLKSIGNTISWDLRSLNQVDCFHPNIVAFPLPDFEIVVSLLQIGQKQGKQVRKALVSVGKLGGKQVQFVKAYTQHIQLTLQIIGSKEDQTRTIDDMNLKYRFPLDTGTPLVQLVRLQIKLPAEESEDDQQESRRNSSIMQLTSEKSSHRQDKSIHNSEALSQRSFDREKIDLQKLIDSQKLGEYVRQNTQSRVFQNWLSEASGREIDEVVSALWNELPQLITHQYANYMVQKLISVCSLPQRIKLIQRLQGDIPGIARNKQGTHSLQTFITLFTTNEEYKLICASIKNNYLSLAQHPNATHFLQKIITLFPISFTVQFMQMVLQDFLSYALDKHAMCVIKQMLKKISELEENSKESQIVLEIKKQFLHIVNFNIDQLICDPYGNYVIQFCYEFFKQDKCAAIAERIIDKFYQFSLQKYSCAVLLKCINNCWTKKETLDRLRNSLNHQVINEMFRNKDANKVLLEIVQRFEDSSLREKIQSQLVLSQPTKFNHDRWGVALGSRSGMVGSEWGNFTEAVKKTNKKKKHYHNQR